MTTTDPVADDVDPVADDGPDPHTTAGKVADLERRRREAVHAGSAAAIEKQHARGKLTARERIGLLLDAGSFTEFDELARHRAHGFGIENNRPYGDGVITGTGTVDGRPVAVYSEDFTVFGGSLGEVYGEKIVKVMDHATKSGVACCQAAGEQDAVEFAKLLLSYLPSNNLDEPPLLPVTPKKHGNIPL
jgi:propionyl-CoA carboxylase beta chain